MFGIKYIKAPPTVYLMQFKGGQIKRQGQGLAFFYYSPSSSLVAVPVGSVEAPFIFEEVSADFQQITVQGQVTYRVRDAVQLAGMLNYTLDSDGEKYVSQDPEKLPQRVIKAVQVLVRKQLAKLDIRAALRASDEIVQQVQTELAKANEITALGVEILGLSILAIRPNPETARALEAGVREALLRDADEAAYARRNAAVEQERGIRENELRTEIAVEQKKRQVREEQMEAERAVQLKRNQIRREEMEADIALEEKNRELVGLAAANSREEADAKAYGVAALMKAYEGTDAKVLQALASVGMDPSKLIALSFMELAGQAGRIGELNISPDLLRELTGKGGN